ncbi:hypothetical protein KQ313_11305 [Synechococcus sp. CS-1325]|uniref:hypothetical protein n=1 Tax=Synechococcus sp. CS-1324 TaxID=2847980 RepID=UPI000DB5647F|nr:hypothetical protein [Synechococcus sp. CS-1324]MCT0200266.1 hypothetical protein [Synechococcus sp. CS-1325]MCT0214279.1 hypothetical protein [Synechococcus sp. CS-1326]PZV01602.1 MAG: hypothetical protein DCF24_03950 [Cyanobium sp.]MCT0230201.1 hypothetical protein [Synechococcus sp. CS-1324]PZV05056.1 MAG: hypothetical protein DCF23_04420 [Cyanobium sp.]
MSSPGPRKSPPATTTLRRELPWLIAEAAIFVVLLNANAPELWFWLVVLVVLLAYRLERWLQAAQDGSP